MNITNLFCLLYIFAVIRYDVSADRPCAARSVGTNKMVCVCNATYCDTIDSPATLPAGQFVQYTSSRAGLRFKKKIGGFGFQSTVFRSWPWFFKGQHRNDVHMKVYRRMTYQSIIGFGGAITDSASIHVLSLSGSTQENLLRSYYSPEGIEYNMIRIPIGGCDYSTHPYAYDDFPGDTTLRHFRLATEDYEYKIPLMQRAIAMSRKTIKLKGAAWSPPIWMKTNNAYSGPGTLKREYYQTYADYHIKFLDEYKKEGLIFWAISTGNEPLQGNYMAGVINALGWYPWDQMQWVRDNLGPALRQSQHNQTKIIALDDVRYLLPWWLDDLRTDLEASSYIDGIAVHWYADSFTPAWILDLTHKNFPNKFLIQTEASSGLNPKQPGSHVDLGSWSRGEDYVKSIIEYINHWGVGWLDWNIALDMSGGPTWTTSTSVDSPIIVNTLYNEFYKQPMFYAMGHFSKFVPEGSMRIGITPVTVDGLESIAFRTPDNAIVLVVWNKWDSKIPLTITDVDRGIANIDVDARSFHTIIYW